MYISGINVLFSKLKHVLHIDGNKFYNIERGDNIFKISISLIGMKVFGNDSQLVKFMSEITSLKDKFKYLYFYIKFLVGSIEQLF